MKKLTVVALLLITLALIAQSTSPGQITLKPLSVSSDCVADPAGDVLCAASDGFYISVAGGAFQKIVAGAIPPPPSPTTISCTTASLSTGTSGNFTASGCTLK